MRLLDLDECMWIVVIYGRIENIFGDA